LAKKDLLKKRCLGRKAVPGWGSLGSIYNLVILEKFSRMGGHWLARRKPKTVKKDRPRYQREASANKARKKREKSRWPTNITSNIN
jgi:hypothetical protein